MKLHTLFGAVALLAAALFAGTASASSWLSTPSAVAKGEVTEVYGGGFAPGASVDIEIVDPAGTTTMTSVVADANGKLLLDVSLDLAGEYLVDAFTAGAVEPVASTLIIASE